MSLTPKNWKSFQHYKDRAPAWIKLHKGLLDDFAFSRLPIASRALAPLLWLLASEYDNGEIPCSFEEIAFRLHMSEKEFKEAVKPLVDGKFFSVASNTLAETEHVDILEEDTNTIEEEETEKELSSAPRPRNDDFENLKKIYPRRKGNYGWKAAERKFNSLVKTGVDPKAIIAAARRLGETLSAKVGTEFIPMPASWLNSEDFIDLAVTSFDQPTQIDWDSICDTYKKFGIWSKHAPGNSPETESCLCPPEILAKHGILVPALRRMDA